MTPGHQRQHETTNLTGAITGTLIACPHRRDHPGRHFSEAHQPATRGVMVWPRFPEHPALTGWARRMVVAAFDEKKVGAHLSDADGRTIDDQTHLHLGGTRSVMLVCYHERKPDT